MRQAGQEGRRTHPELGEEEASVYLPKFSCSLLSVGDGGLGELGSNGGICDRGYSEGTGCEGEFSTENWGVAPLLFWAPPLYPRCS